MTNISESSNVSHPYNSYSNSTKVLAVTAIALALIGILAVCKVGALSAVSSYAYVFGLGATAFFLASCICCCKSCQSPANTQANKLQAEPAHQPYVQPTPKVELPLEIFPKTAEENFVLGRKCVQGKKNNKNYGEASFYYQEARNLGHVPATYYLARCHYFGKGIPKDEKTGLLFFQEAADKGDVRSILTLALFDIKQGKIDEAKQRINTLPDQPVHLAKHKEMCQTWPINAPNEIALFERYIQMALGHERDLIKLSRSITWQYV